MELALQHSQAAFGGADGLQLLLLQHSTWQHQQPLERKAEYEGLIEAIELIILHTISTPTTHSHTDHPDAPQALDVDVSACAAALSLQQRVELGRTCSECAREWLHRPSGCAFVAEWRAVYACAGLLRVAGALQRESATHEAGVEALEVLDLMWMFAPLGFRRAIQSWVRVAVALTRPVAVPNDAECMQLFRAAQSQVSDVPGALLRDPNGVRVDVPRRDCPDEIWFAANCLSLSSFASSATTKTKKSATKPNPLVITGLMEHWPAMEKWQDGAFWLGVLGHRHVPVEVGAQYTHADWSTRMLTGQDFFTRYLVGCSQEDEKGVKEVGYLAQHDLLEQIPSLKKDIHVPDYCFLNAECVQADTAVTKAWLGPRGTVTPIHHDPDHNIFTQVAGSKYIRLYDPAHTHRMRMHSPYSVTPNTSTVDLLAVEGKHTSGPSDRDDFSRVPYMDVVLGPGEALFIPKGWLHFVLSLSTSVSLSHWFK